ncbi:MAG: T9SS type A sorting domain-containing protein [Flavobacteriales bacterium]|nr:T9SS type A sorting domain-containing protein [Flavobacteriales bacterium]MCB9178386.1 T9SS type A sorting domain-containing protein [Flavobacteriales bacterium]
MTAPLIGLEPDASRETAYPRSTYIIAEVLRRASINGRIIEVTPYRTYRLPSLFLQVRGFGHGSFWHLSSIAIEDDRPHPFHPAPRSGVLSFMMARLLLSVVLVFAYASTIVVNGQSYSLENCSDAGPVNIYAARDLAGAPDGKLFAVGAYSGSFTFTNMNLSSDAQGAVFITKVSEDLDVEWLMTLCENYSTSFDLLSPSIEVGPDGQIVVAVSFADTLSLFETLHIPDDGKGIVLIALSSSGELLWHQEIEGDDIRKQGVSIDGDGNILVTGGALGDIFIAKYDPLGNQLWWSTAGGSSGADLTWAIISNSSNGIYVTGRLISGGQAQFGSLSLTPPNGTYMVGFLAKYSASGVPEWIRYVYSQTFARFSVINSLVCSNDDIYIAGYFEDSYLRFSNGGGNFGQQPNGLPRSFLAKYGSNGDLQWVKVPPYSGTGSDGALALTTDGTMLHALLNFQNLITHDLGPIASYGSHDLLLEHSDTNGTLLTNFQIGGTGMESGDHIIHHAGHIYILGGTNGTSLMSPADCAVAVSSNMFILRFRDESVGVSDQDEQYSTSLYPNPNDGTFTLKAPRYTERIILSDAWGRIILQSNYRWSEAGVPLDLGDVAPGVYWVRAQGNNQSLSTKMLVW